MIYFLLGNVAFDFLLALFSGVVQQRYDRGVFWLIVAFFLFYLAVQLDAQERRAKP